MFNVKNIFTWKPNSQTNFKLIEQFTILTLKYCEKNLSFFSLKSYLKTIFCNRTRVSILKLEHFIHSKQKSFRNRLLLNNKNVLYSYKVK